jgi:general nucleoside transport system ATP-binding protein
LEPKDHIRMESITKIFGSLRANDNVNLTVKRGEVHAILGENGAGKSTLMNILSGIYSSDSGNVILNGKRKSFSSPQDAIDAGVGMIYQHFKLVDAMTAWENICAGPTGSQILKPKILKKKITELSNSTGLFVDLDKKVRDMGVGEKQTLEILKVLYRGADILILDEPTTVLTPQETETLFSIIRGMKAVGKTTIIITHKLYEVMAISDRVTILRKGQTISTVETREVSQKELAEMMVGKSMDMEFPSSDAACGDTVMEVKNLSIDDKECMRSLNNISFNLCTGEILGIAGVSGSGQKQLCQSLVGLQKIDQGEIIMKGENLAGLTAREIIAKGIIRLNFVPEDRLGMGLVGGMDLVDNIMLRDYRNSKGMLLDRKTGIRKTKKLVKSLQIMHPGINRPISVLSGGNLQKVLIGREIISDPEVLVTAYPVRGLDLGVTHKVIDLLNEQKSKGVGVLLVAEDLDLLLAVCDRVMVLYCGQISGIVDTKTTTKEELGMLMSSIDGECADD